jgi:hypothetical protein
VKNWSLPFFVARFFLTSSAKFPQDMGSPQASLSHADFPLLATNDTKLSSPGSAILLIGTSFFAAIRLSTVSILEAAASLRDAVWGKLSVNCATFSRPLSTSRCSTLFFQQDLQYNGGQIKQRRTCHTISCICSCICFRCISPSCCERSLRCRFRLAGLRIMRSPCLTPKVLGLARPSRKLASSTRTSIN